MAYQNDVGQVFIFEDINDILDEHTEIDSLRKQMRTFAEAAERRGKDPMSLRAQELGDGLPAPSAVPGAVNQHVGCAFARSGCIHQIVRGCQVRLRLCLSRGAII